VPILGLTDLTVQSLKSSLYIDRKTPAFALRFRKRNDLGRYQATAPKVGWVTILT